MTKSDRPRQPRRITGKWLALAMAIAVQLGFLAVLVFSVSWQNREPEAVTAELYAPPVKAPPAPPPKPAPPVEPPKPEPKPEPPPPPPPPPPPQVAQPDPRAVEIALKAKREEERKKRVEAEKREAEKREADRREAEKREAEKKLREQKEAEDRRKLEERKKLEEKRLAEARERQQRESEALRAQAEREAQARLQAERDAQIKARESAERAAKNKAEADWIRRIQAKVKGNVIVPAELAGNPEAIFDVVQLPTGEIIDATLRKSSGNRAYDDAVQRAIIKSSPLPRPERVELFQRTLTLKFRPQD
jgi:colicin import membrane protein